MLRLIYVTFLLDLACLAVFVAYYFYVQICLVILCFVVMVFPSLNNEKFFCGNLNLEYIWAMNVEFFNSMKEGVLFIVDYLF